MENNTNKEEPSENAQDVSQKTEQKGFKIVEVDSDDKFLNGNIPKASVETLLSYGLARKDSHS